MRGQSSTLPAIIERLVAQGYLLRDLERALHLSRGYLSRLRHSKVTPSFQLEALLRLVDASPRSTLAAIAKQQGEVPPSTGVNPAATASVRAAPVARSATRAPLLLRELAPLFDKGGVRWALTGARALEAYGLRRATVDVDILVHTDDRHALRIVRELGHELGFFSDEHVFCFPPRRKDPNDKLDIHFPRLPPLDSAVLRPEHRRVFGAVLPVVAPLDLAAWKLMSLTAKDQADAAALISLGFVDRAAVAGLLTSLLAVPQPADPYATRLFAPSRALAALAIGP